MTTKSFWSAAFSSKTEKWDTPQGLVDDLAPLFPWDLDVCADRPNVCQNYYDGSYMKDGLQAPWEGLCWMNPPYGRKIGNWVSRAAMQASYLSLGRKATVVGLLPARTDTRWFHNWCTKADVIVFIKGRLRFGSNNHWRYSYRQKIMTLPKFDRILLKIGGLQCDEECREYVKCHWPDNMKIDYDNWSNADWLKKESAPFPSIFAVWGTLNISQYRKLASYGVAMDKRTFPLEIKR